MSSVDGWHSVVPSHAPVPPVAPKAVVNAGLLAMAEASESNMAAGSARTLVPVSTAVWPDRESD